VKGDFSMQAPPYDPAIGLEICAYRREGKALNAISSLLGLASPWVIEQWARAVASSKPNGTWFTSRMKADNPPRLSSIRQKK
jgi:hypothetical protein